MDNYLGCKNFNKPEYTKLLQELNQRDNESYLMVDEGSLRLVGTMMRAWQTIKGLFGFENYTDPIRVNHQLLKVLKYGENKGFFSDQDIKHLLENLAHSAPRIREPAHITAIFQKALFSTANQAPAPLAKRTITPLDQELRDYEIQNATELAEAFWLRLFHTYIYSPPSNTAFDDYRKAQNFALQNNWGAAIPLLEQAIAKEPADVESKEPKWRLELAQAYLAKATEQLSLQLNQEALELCNKALASLKTLDFPNDHPFYQDAHQLQTQVLIKKMKSQAAQEHYNIALDELIEECNQCGRDPLDMFTQDAHRQLQALKSESYAKFMLAAASHEGFKGNAHHFYTKAIDPLTLAVHARFDLPLYEALIRACLFLGKRALASQDLETAEQRINEAYYHFETLRSSIATANQLPVVNEIVDHLDRLAENLEDEEKFSDAVEARRKIETLKDDATSKAKSLYALAKSYFVAGDLFHTLIAASRAEILHSSQKYMSLVQESLTALSPYSKNSQSLPIADEELADFISNLEHILKKNPNIIGQKLLIKASIMHVHQLCGLKQLEQACRVADKTLDKCASLTASIGSQEVLQFSQEAYVMKCTLHMQRNEYQEAVQTLKTALKETKETKEALLAHCSSYNPLFLPDTEQWGKFYLALANDPFFSTEKEKHIALSIKLFQQVLEQKFNEPLFEQIILNRLKISNLKISEDHLEEAGAILDRASANFKRLSDLSPHAECLKRLHADLQKTVRALLLRYQAKADAAIANKQGAIQSLQDLIRAAQNFQASDPQDQEISLLLKEAGASLKSQERINDYRQGQIFASQGNWDEAIVFLKRAVGELAAGQHAAGSPPPEYLTELARTYMAKAKQLGVSASNREVLALCDQALATLAIAPSANRALVSKEQLQLQQDALIKKMICYGTENKFAQAAKELIQDCQQFGIPPMSLFTQENYSQLQTLGHTHFGKLMLALANHPQLKQEAHLFYAKAIDPLTLSLNAHFDSQLYEALIRACLFIGNKALNADDLETSEQRVHEAFYHFEVFKSSFAAAASSPVLNELAQSIEALANKQEKERQFSDAIDTRNKLAMLKENTSAAQGKIRYLLAQSHQAEGNDVKAILEAAVASRLNPKQDNRSLMHEALERLSEQTKTQTTLPLSQEDIPDFASTLKSLLLSNDHPAWKKLLIKTDMMHIRHLCQLKQFSQVSLPLDEIINLHQQLPLEAIDEPTKEILKEVYDLKFTLHLQYHEQKEAIETLKTALLQTKQSKEEFLNLHTLNASKPDSLLPLLSQTQLSHLHYALAQEAIFMKDREKHLLLAIEGLQSAIDKHFDETTLEQLISHTLELSQLHITAQDLPRAKESIERSAAHLMDLHHRPQGSKKAHAKMNMTLQAKWQAALKSLLMEYQSKADLAQKAGQDPFETLQEEMTSWKPSWIYAMGDLYAQQDAFPMAHLVYVCAQEKQNTHPDQAVSSDSLNLFAKTEKTLGSHYFEQGSHQNNTNNLLAIEHLTLYYELQHSLFDPSFNDLITAYIRIGKNLEAIKCYEAFRNQFGEASPVSIDPIAYENVAYDDDASKVNQNDLLSALIHQADHYEQSLDYSKAIRLYTKALEFAGPKNTQLAKQLLSIGKKTEHPRQTIDAYRAALPYLPKLELSPLEKRSFYQKLGGASYQLQKKEDAKNYLNKAIAIENETGISKDPKQYQLLGIIHEEMGQLKLAHEAYKQALDIQPDRQSADKAQAITLTLADQAYAAAKTMQARPLLDLKVQTIRQNLQDFHTQSKYVVDFYPKPNASKTTRKNQIVNALGSFWKTYQQDNQDLEKYLTNPSDDPLTLLKESSLAIELLKKAYDGKKNHMMPTDMPEDLKIFIDCLQDDLEAMEALHQAASQAQDLADQEQQDVALLNRASSLYQEAFDRDKNSIDAYANAWIDVHMQLGKWQEAIELFEYCQDPSIIKKTTCSIDPKAYLLSIPDYKQTEHIERPLQFARQLLAKITQYQENNQGRNVHMAPHYERILQALNASISDMFVQRALQHVQLGAFDEALNDLKLAQQQSTPTAAYYAAYGSLFDAAHAQKATLNGQPFDAATAFNNYRLKAIDAYLEGIKCDPKNAQCYAKLGQLITLMSKDKSATGDNTYLIAYPHVRDPVPFLRTAILLDPGNKDLVEALSEAIKTKLNNPMTINNRTRLYTQADLDYANEMKND